MKPLEMCMMKYKLQGDIKARTEVKREWCSVMYFSLFVKIFCVDIPNANDYKKSGKSKVQ